MADPKLLEFTVKSFTAEKLEIKVNNISGKALDDTLTIELYVPTYLVNSKINVAAKAAVTNTKPIGAASLAGVVSGPAGWSVWVKPEGTNTTVAIAFFNDVDQSGNELGTPIQLAAGAEFVIGIPLNPQANRTAVNVLYSYQHGTDEDDQRGDGKLDLKADTSEPIPNVRLFTTAKSPTAIPAMTLVKVFWEIENGVSATLRGPVPGGNNELPLESDPDADFKIAGGFIEVMVVSGMTYILQAQVTRPGKANIEVVRMLTLDTSNNKFTFLSPRPRRVLPYGLIEIDWSAWGVKRVMFSVSGHTTRTINLTQQTLGRFYEGSGVMRVTATKEIEGVVTINEQITLDASPEKPKSSTVEVVPWRPMKKPELDGSVMGLAVIAPKIAVLTTHGLYIAQVGDADPSPPLEKLAFSLKASPSGSSMWQALAAVDQKFICLRTIMSGMPEVELAPFTVDGNADEIPPVTLPPEVRPLAFAPGAVFDFVGFSGRAYFVVETSKPLGSARRAWSVAFDSRTRTRKADLRAEPLLEPLIGYRLVSFDDGLYALNRDSGQMYRFDLTKEGKLEEPKKAASAVKKGEGSGAKEECMVKDGLLVPVGRLLVVLGPTSVPSLASLERFGRQNTLRYTSTSPSSDDIPQDLVYNPQKDYWGRCGHDLDVEADSKAAFRGGDSMRLWVIQPDNSIKTLAAGAETLFAPDYVFEFPTKPLPPYLNKKRQFKITNNTGLHLLPLDGTLRNVGLTDFYAKGPAELTSPLPNDFPNGKTETVEFRYNDVDPVPINLRFLVKNTSGFKHFYVLELTFSGPDLAAATSVFKRIKVESNNRTTIAEIPDTAVQHSTNNPIVVPAPRRLIEGVNLRAHNATTYPLWREAPEAKDRHEVSNRYFGDEIKITYETPTFFLLAHGAGQLDVTVDFALPLGIEISPSSQPQLKLIRITADKSTGLNPELLPNRNDTSYECKISYLLKQELNTVYIGDGVATAKGDAIFLPVAHNSVQAVVQVWKINPENLSTSAMTAPQIQSTGVFSTPNSIALSNDFIFAMFGDTDIHVLDYSLQVQARVSVADAYTVVTGIRCAYENVYSLLGFKKDKVATQGINFNHVLGTKLIVKSSGPNKVATGNVREVVLDTVKGFREQNRMTGFPPWVSSKTVSPMALSTSNVSPGGDRVREAAVCIDGGLFVVGFSDRPIRALALESAGREEDVVFGREGKSIYCLHSQGDNQGLRVSRVDNHAWKQTHGLALPRGEGVADLTTDSRQPISGTPYKNQRSTSMVISRDEKWLFVSHGRSIFKIDVAKMELRDTYKMELPCRVFHVWWGKPTEGSHAVYGTPSSCTLLYAIGASYRGDGVQAREFKTQLYKLAIPD